MSCPAPGYSLEQVLSASSAALMLGFLIGVFAFRRFVREALRGTP